MNRFLLLLILFCLSGGTSRSAQANAVAGPAREPGESTAAAQTAAPHVAGQQATNTPERANLEDHQAGWLPFVAALLVFLLAVTGMSIGVLLRNRELKGSCGGLAAMAGQDGHSACDLCVIPRDQCQDADVRARLVAKAAEDAPL